MRRGRGSWRRRSLWCALATLWVGAVLAPSGAAAGAPTVHSQDHPAAGDAPVLGDDHADGGERETDHLAEALREGTPEELQRRREEIARRLEEAGSAAELARRTEAEAAQALAEIDGALAAAQQEVADATVAVNEATAELESTRTRHVAAQQRARDAEADLRAAAVDMFINPPQAHSVRAALSGTVEEEMASTGLLVGRAETRRQLSVRRDRARLAAARAKRSAQVATDAATAARATAEQATTELSAQLELRNAELQRRREELALVESEVSDLQLTDSVLATRLALDGLARSGSVAAVAGPDGNWVPISDGLPTGADMVRIGETGVRVHHLVAPNVWAMFLAALEDGVVLDGSAFRDSSRQIQLRASHCGTSYEALFTMPSSSCSPPTARPGQSMHERGLAIDFTEGGRTLSRSSVSFLWLVQNAADFGFFNLPSEPWHWSVNGN